MLTFPQLIYSTATSRNRKYTNVSVSNDATNWGSFNHKLLYCLVRIIKFSVVFDIAKSELEKSVGPPI